MNIELTAKDICKIIDTCKRSGVLELKIDGLCINFAITYNNEPPASIAGLSFKAGTNPPDNEQKELETLDELMLSNPLAYEEALNARDDEG